MNRAPVHALGGSNRPRSGKRRFCMDRRIIIGIAVGLTVAIALFWTFTALGGECGQAVRAIGGGPIAVIRECM